MLTDQNYVTMQVTEKEKRLVELCRTIGYGQCIIFVENNQPVRIEEVKKSVKL